MSDILRRLREPPFGTETSERNLMTAAADEIERLIKREQALTEALKGIGYQAEMRITDGDEMGPRVWRIALEDILADAARTISQTTGESL